MYLHLSMHRRSSRKSGRSDFGAALLRAVDELRGPQAMVSAQTWQQLASRYDQRQLLELLALIGTYTMVAHILNSCGVAIDDWLTNPASPRASAYAPTAAASASPTTTCSAVVPIAAGSPRPSWSASARDIRRLPR